MHALLRLLAAPTLLLTAIAPTSTRAFAQTPVDECTAALNKDLIHRVRDEQQQYAYLSIIDQQTFDELKHNQQLSLSMPIVSGLINASSDYSEFSTHRDSYFAQKKLNITQSMIQEELYVVTAPEAYTAWTTCEQGRSVAGFYAWKMSESPNSLVIGYHWQSPPGQNPPLQLEGTVTGGRATNGAPNGKLFPANARVGNNGSHSVTIRRGPSTGAGMRPTIEVVINGGEYKPVVITSASDPVRARVVGQAVVATRYPPTALIVTTVREASGESENEDGQTCRQRPCAGVGDKWQASAVPLTVAAASGRTLRNARLRCVGYSDARWAAISNAYNSGNATLRQAVADTYGHGQASPCGWTFNSDITYAADKSTATVTAYGYTVPVTFVLSAEEVMVDSSQAGKVDNTTIPVRLGEGFTVFAPSQGTTSVLVTIQGQQFAVAPGTSSGNGLLRFEGPPVPALGGTYYNYTIPRQEYRTVFGAH